MTSRYNPPCNEGDNLTRCVLWRLRVRGGTIPGCSESNDIPRPDLMPFLEITKLPIEQDPLCGECDEYPIPGLLQDWLNNNPEFNLWNLYDSENEAFTNLLMEYICQQHNRDLIISYSAPLLDKSIVYNGNRYQLVTYDTSWYNLCSGRGPLTEMGSMPCDECECFHDGRSGPLNTCPQYGMMPWWQSPAFKYGADGIANTNFCTIFPPVVDGYRCNILYETSRYVDTIGTAADVVSTDSPTADPFGHVPIYPENWEPAAAFIEVYQKWVDKNKNNPVFESEFGDAVIIFYGWIKGGLNKSTNMPEWDGNPSISKIKLETWGLDSRKKLVRQSVGWQQYPANYNNKVVYVVLDNKATEPPTIRKKNLLITFDMNTCVMEETFVVTAPDMMIPEMLVVKYIPGADKLLSESNPEEYRQLVREYENRFGCNKGTCCVTLKDSKGYFKHDCKVVNQSYCSVEGMSRFYADVPTSIGLTIVSTSFDASTDNCANVSCEWQLPLPKVLGTCCIPGYDPNGDWGCMINSKEECAELKGFWEEPQPNGVGGINPPSCTERGVTVAADSSIVLLGPRKCSNLGPSIPDNPNPGGDIEEQIGACCWTAPYTSKIATDIPVSNSLAYVRTIQKTVQDPTNLNWSTIDISLFMFKDGSTIKLCFPSVEILNKLYPVTTTEQARNAKIESEFSIKDKNSDNQFYRVQFKKIEGSCVILTTIKA